MNKLKLTLESLTVESFDTTATQRTKGTVFGEQCTCYTQCTCPQTCPYTCDDNSCAGSCQDSYPCMSDIHFTQCSCTCPEN